LEKRKEMPKYFVLIGLLLLTAGSALAQGEFPKVETSPAFMYVRNNPNLSGAFIVVQWILLQERFRHDGWWGF
jgi:hypothetical protein